MLMQHWVVTLRYAAAGPRPGNRRHPAPEDFCQRTVVGPTASSTVEAILDLAAVSDDVRGRVRNDNVVRDFVDNKLACEAPYPHRAIGMRYVNTAVGEQLVEWSIEFTHVTRLIVDPIAALAEGAL